MDSVSHIIRFQYLKEHRNSVRIDDDTENGGDNSQALPTIEDISTISTLMCEYMAATSQFVQFGYDYYKYVCGTDDANSSSSEEKSCLIPVCSFQPNNSTQSRSGSKRANAEDTAEKTTLNFSDDSHLLRRNDKRQRVESSSSSTTGDEEDGRGQGLDSYCVRGVDNALQILSKAADCLRHTVELWNWATNKLSQKSLLDHLGGWEQGKPYTICQFINYTNNDHDRIMSHNRGL